MCKYGNKKNDKISLSTRWKELYKYELNRGVWWYICSFNAWLQFATSAYGGFEGLKTQQNKKIRIAASGLLFLNHIVSRKVLFCCATLLRKLKSWNRNRFIGHGASACSIYVWPMANQWKPAPASARQHAWCFAQEVAQNRFLRSFAELERNGQSFELSSINIIFSQCFYDYIILFG